MIGNIAVVTVHDMYRCLLSHFDRSWSFIMEAILWRMWRHVITWPLSSLKCIGQRLGRFQKVIFQWNNKQKISISAHIFKGLMTQKINFSILFDLVISHVYITINLFNLCQQFFLPFYIYFLKCWHRLNEP
jgi:hypothetical protein